MAASKRVEFGVERQDGAQAAASHQAARFAGRGGSDAIEPNRVDIEG
jgi:hypothetical protein